MILKSALVKRGQGTLGHFIERQKIKVYICLFFFSQSRYNEIANVVKRFPISTDFIVTGVTCLIIKDQRFWFKQKSPDKSMPNSYLEIQF